MDITEYCVTVTAKWRTRRADAIMQEAIAKIRRARRRDRPAMLERYMARMGNECVRVVAR